MSLVTVCIVVAVLIGSVLLLRVRVAQQRKATDPVKRPAQYIGTSVLESFLGFLTLTGFVLLATYGALLIYVAVIGPANSTKLNLGLIKTLNEFRSTLSLFDGYWTYAIAAVVAVWASLLMYNAGKVFGIVKVNSTGQFVDPETVISNPSILDRITEGLMSRPVFLVLKRGAKLRLIAAEILILLSILGAHAGPALALRVANLWDTTVSAVAREDQLALVAAMQQPPLGEKPPRPPPRRRSNK